MSSTKLVWLGLIMIVVGCLVVAAGTFTESGGSSSSGGFVLIGPIPIVFGSGPNSGTLATVAIVISVVMIVLYVASFLFWGSARRREARV